MIQELSELDEFHKKEDPWDYENNTEDSKRISYLLGQLNKKKHTNVLDIGCGQGFVTKQLPGSKIIGVDVSQEAIKHAMSNNEDNRISYACCSIFDLNTNYKDNSFDLIVITGVLYSQYIGNSSSLIYLIIDKLLKKGGTLISVHINSWYRCQFPYFKVKEILYPYRAYNHKLELYIK